MIKPQSLWLGLCISAALCLMLVPHVLAQPVLVEASPAPNSILTAAPERIELTFERSISASGTTIEVRSEDGTFSVSNRLLIDPTNRFKVSMELPSLVDGVYQVHYAARGIGGSTLAVGSYTFTIDPPDPELELVQPVNGTAFAHDESIILELRTQNFEFGFFNNRIRIYIDNELHDEIQATSYQIDDLAPGVHEIRTVLVKLDDTEFPETENTIIVAIAQEDRETEGRIEAAAAEPDPGLNLTLPQAAGIIILTLILLGIGIWLGRTSIRRTSH